MGLIRTMHWLPSRVTYSLSCKWPCPCVWQICAISTWPGWTWFRFCMSCAVVLAFCAGQPTSFKEFQGRGNDLIRKSPSTAAYRCIMQMQRSVHQLSTFMFCRPCNLHLPDPSSGAEGSPDLSPNQDALAAESVCAPSLLQQAPLACLPGSAHISPELQRSATSK